MNRRRITIFALLALAYVTSGPVLKARQTQDLATLVAQYYPQVLVQRSLESRGVELRREQCFAVISASPAGAPLAVIAAYTNLTSGAIRLLHAAGTGFEEATPTGAGYFSGSRCEAQALDVNNDGRKEAFVHFLSRNSTQDWLFDWDGENLRNLTPTAIGADGLAETSLVNTSLIDVDGDGVMEALTFSEPPLDDQPSRGELFRLSGTSYVLERPIVGLRRFERASGAPQTDTATILLPSGAVGPFKLRIVNGSGTTGSGKRVEDAVQSGRIWWNGQEIVSPNHFGNHVATIERTVTAQMENELKVRLAGSPGGRIAIVIDATSWTP